MSVRNYTSCTVGCGFDLEAGLWKKSKFFQEILEMCSRVYTEIINMAKMPRTENKMAAGC